MEIISSCFLQDFSPSLGSNHSHQHNTVPVLIQSKKKKKKHVPVLTKYYWERFSITYKGTTLTCDIIKFKQQKKHTMPLQEKVNVLKL